MPLCHYSNPVIGLRNLEHSTPVQSCVFGKPILQVGFNEFLLTTV